MPATVGLGASGSLAGSESLALILPGSDSDSEPGLWTVPGPGDSRALAPVTVPGHRDCQLQVSQ